MNCVNLTGRLVNDPTRNDTSNGVVTTFRLAVDGRSHIFLDVDSWGHLAGRVATHLTKGRRVGVTGRWSQREYHDRATHAKRLHDFVVADHVDFLDPLADAGCGDGLTAAT